MALNRGRNLSNDTWLTPPDLVKALGPFDLDPCCPPRMPWKTARKLICQPQDGLAAVWKGRVWLNPPYSDPMPWLQRFFEHGSGIALLPARSPETAWGQLALQRAASILFLRGRILFHHEDGTKSMGKYLPNMLVAASEADVRALETAAAVGYAGTMVRGEAVGNYTARSTDGYDKRRG